MLNYLLHSSLNDKIKKCEIILNFNTAYFFSSKTLNKFNWGISRLLIQSFTLEI